MNDEWKAWHFSGIYGIRHIESQKIYVGQSQNIAIRLAEHRLGYRSGPHLRNAIKQQGWDAFEKVILELVVNLEILTEREQHWIDEYDAANPAKGYNLCPAAGSSRGYHHTDAARAAISTSRLAAPIKGVPKSPEHRAAISAALMGMSKSPEHCAAISAAKKGVPLSPTARATHKAVQNRPEVRYAKSLSTTLQRMRERAVDHAAAEAAGQLRLFD